MKEALESRIAKKHPPYTKAQAIREADRCFYCYDAPCMKACPTSIDVPSFIKKIATDNVLSSAKTIFSANILGLSCAKICPVEVLCAGACVYHGLHDPPIEIGRLQDYATTYAIDHHSPEEILGPKVKGANKKVALIGGGPASLAAAAMLAHASITPTIYEKKPKAGGLNAYGVAPYKLRHDEAQVEIAWLAQLGIEFCLGIEIGLLDMPDKMVSWSTLLKNYDGIFIGVGLGKDNFLPLDALYGPGVMGACEAIAQIKTDPNFDISRIKTAHVIGGGNTAVDIAHELKLLGVPCVNMLYRKNIEDMSAYVHERNDILKAGVKIHENVLLKAIARNSDGSLIGFSTTTSDDVVPSDLIVFAIGQEGAREHFLMPDLPFDERGRIIVDARTHRIEQTKLWAAGDSVNGGKEVVNAVAEAKLAVADMIRVLR
jgi:dihydropyrimidine dehydrogenase (NAD+) subunit PreT